MILNKIILFKLNTIFLFSKLSNSKYQRAAQKNDKPQFLI